MSIPSPNVWSDISNASRRSVQNYPNHVSHRSDTRQKELHQRFDLLQFLDKGFHSLTRTENDV